MTNVVNPAAARPRDPPHRLFDFHRDDGATRTMIEVNLAVRGRRVPATLFGGFLEHLSFAILGGVSAELLSNPTLAIDANLTEAQREDFLSNGRLLEDLHRTGDETGPFRERWVSTPLPTGFGVAVLDEPSRPGIPFGWTSPRPEGVQTAVGRIGSAVRLKPKGELCQALFLPGRVRQLVARVWVRLAPGGGSGGSIEVGLRRRGHAAWLARAVRPLGETDGGVAAWLSVCLEFELSESLVAIGEPIDFCLRWNSSDVEGTDLLVDRVALRPVDATDGLDPDVIETARDLRFSSLRWPGGNFASVYHWREGVGPVDRRPTVANQAWGGLECHLFGTDEFIDLCRAIGSEPHITVNSGTASAEEAAAWVEYCNGASDTPMGALRRRHGHREPFGVRIWEVGNEAYASWQGGHHGAEENAFRFAEFARAMRAASPIPLELIACGNSFDFVSPGPEYDQVVADGTWHEALLSRAPDDIDFISLHSLPMNDHLLADVPDEEAHLAILGQVVTWERRFLPDLLKRCAAVPRSSGRGPIRLAVTEWGPLGAHPTRLMAENFGAAIYAATFLAMLIRNAERIPIASPNGFMHGGCIRKVGGRIFLDPQVTVQAAFRQFIGWEPAACTVTGPGYDIDHPADIGARDRDVPIVDAIVCRDQAGSDIRAALVNRHPTRPMSVEMRVAGYDWPMGATIETLADSELSARATPAEPDRFARQVQRLEAEDGVLVISLPPASVVWVRS